MEKMQLYESQKMFNNALKQNGCIVTHFNYLVIERILVLLQNLDKMYKSQVKNYIFQELKSLVNKGCLTEDELNLVISTVIKSCCNIIVNSNSTESQISLRENLQTLEDMKTAHDDFVTSILNVHGIDVSLEELRHLIQGKQSVERVRERRESNQSTKGAENLRRNSKQPIGPQNLNTSAGSQAFESSKFSNREINQKLLSERRDSFEDPYYQSFDSIEEFQDSGNLIENNEIEGDDLFGRLSWEQLINFRTRWCLTRHSPKQNGFCPDAHHEINHGWLRRNWEVFNYNPIKCPYVSWECGIYKNNCPSMKVRPRNAQDPSCHFAHSAEELFFHPQIYKTQICKYGSKCKFRQVCPFIHTQEELQTSQPNRNWRRFRNFKVPLTGLERLLASMRKMGLDILFPKEKQELTFEVIWSILCLTQGSTKLTHRELVYSVHQKLEKMKIEDISVTKLRGLCATLKYAGCFEVEKDVETDTSTLKLVEGVTNLKELISRFETGVKCFAKAYKIILTDEEWAEIVIPKKPSHVQLKLTQPKTESQENIAPYVNTEERGLSGNDNLNQKNQRSSLSTLFGQLKLENSPPAPSHWRSLQQTQSETGYNFGSFPSFDMAYNKENDIILSNNINRNESIKDSNQDFDVWNSEFISPIALQMKEKMQQKTHRSNSISNDLIFCQQNTKYELWEKDIPFSNPNVIGPRPNTTTSTASNHENPYFALAPTSRKSIPENYFSQFGTFQNASRFR